MAKDRDGKGKKKKGLIRRLLVPGVLAGVWFWRKQKLEANDVAPLGDKGGPAAP